MHEEPDERAENTAEGANCATLAACLRCGVEFTRRRRDQRYCGSSCRARASQQRKADEIADVLAELERLAARLRRRGV
jgi:hypothetical protein